MTTECLGYISSQNIWWRRLALETTFAASESTFICYNPLAVLHIHYMLYMQRNDTSMKWERQHYRAEEKRDKAVATNRPLFSGQNCLGNLNIITMSWIYPGKIH